MISDQLKLLSFHWEPPTDAKNVWNQSDNIICCSTRKWPVYETTEASQSSARELIKYPNFSSLELGAGYTSFIMMQEFYGQWKFQLGEKPQLD